MARFFSKRYYLPLKWRLKRFAEAHQIEYPHPSVLQSLRDGFTQDLLKAKQEQRAHDAAVIAGKLEMVKYVLEYGRNLQGQEDISERGADSDQA